MTSSVSHVGERPQIRRAFFSAAIVPKNALASAASSVLRIASSFSRLCVEERPSGFSLVVELRADVREIAADDVTDRFAACGLGGAQRRDHSREVGCLGRIRLLPHAVAERPREQRHDLELPPVREEVLQQHDFEFDGVLGNVRERVVEQAVAEVLLDAVHIILVGFDQPERGVEVLAAECESVRRVMRRADNDEDTGVGVLDEFAKAVAVGHVAAAVVHVRNEDGAQALRGRRGWPRPLAGQSRSAGGREESCELLAEFVGVR